MGRPLAFVAHSVGPLENCASRGIVRYVFSKARFASTREEISRAILARMGIDPARIELIPDTAFAITAASRGELDHYLSRKGLRGKRFAVVTARFWSFPGHGDEEAARRYRCYLDALAAMSDHVVEQRVADVVLLVVHNDGQHISFENDARPVGQIHASMRHKDHATVVADDLSPAMQAALYGAAVLTIGTRMHSVIFALSAGGIATAVAYNHKTDGVMDMLGLGEYVLPIDSITPGAATAMVDRVLADRAAVTARAQDAIAEFRVTIKDALRRILLST
jgi:colanic acid/amylovoran biosynthesis protein